MGSSVKLVSLNDFPCPVSYLMCTNYTPSPKLSILIPSHIPSPGSSLKLVSEQALSQ